MLDTDVNSEWMDLFSQWNLMKEEERDFLEISSDDQQKMIENRLKNSELISYDEDKRMMINVEHVDHDYLLKSSKESSGI